MSAAVNKLLNSLQNEYDNVYFDIELKNTRGGRCIKVINSINNLNIDKRHRDYEVKKSISCFEIHDFESDFDNRIEEICETLKNKHITHSDLLAF